MATKFEYYETGDPLSTALVDDGWWYAQTFTPVLPHSVTSIKLKGFRSTSDITGTLTISIKATDVNGLPTGADLTSGTYNIANLPVGLANRDWFEVALTPYTLSSGIKYAIVCRGSGSYPTNGYYSQQFGTSDTYPNQWAVYSGDGGSTWEDIGVSDFLFSEWGISAFVPRVMIID